MGEREHDHYFGPDIQIGPDGRPICRGWMWAASRSTPPEHRFVRLSEHMARRILDAIGDARTGDPTRWLDRLHRAVGLDDDVLAWLQGQPEPTLHALLEAAARVAGMCATWRG